MLNGSGYFTFPLESIITKSLPTTSDSLRIVPSILPDTSAFEPVDSIKYESRLINNTEDLYLKQPINLYSPPNINTVVRYDYNSNRYVFENRIASNIISTPFSMSSEEYREYRKREDQTSFFRNRNS